jgi:DNA-binding CsgD family transcriptional regulator
MTMESTAYDLALAEACGTASETAPALFLAPVPAAHRPREQVRLLARERETVDEHLARAGAGEAAAFVVRGAVGSGKTTLLDDALAHRPELHVVHLAASESERDLPLAGGHRLCAALSEQIDGLPAPQRHAVEVVLGREEGELDRLLLAVATLGLLKGAGAGRPVVCVVDDAHLLDAASLEVLAFGSRRGGTQAVTLVLLVSSPVAAFGDLPEVQVRGIAPEEARALVTTTYPGRLPAWVLDRVVAEGRGNPAALLRLGAELASDDGAGGFGVPGATVGDDDALVSDRQAMVATLEPRTRRVLLLAAAQLDGDPTRCWDAVAVLDIPATAVDDAASRRLLDFDVRITFCESALRVAAYRSATVAERRVVHDALAGLCDPEREPALRAWHRSLTTLEADDEIADALEQAMEDARAKSGPAGAAAFLAQAARLTSDPARRARRALAAAQLERRRGATTTASRLLDLASGAWLGPGERAQREWLRTELAFLRGDPVPVDELLDAAAGVSTVDPELGRHAHLTVLDAVLHGGRDVERDAATAAGRAAQASGRSETPGPADLLRDGLAALLIDGFAAAAPTLRRAVTMANDHDAGPAGLAGRVAHEVWDVTANDLAAHRVERARERGDLKDLVAALDELAAGHAYAGELELAAEVADEAAAVARRSGDRPDGLGSRVLAAWQGAETRVRELVDATRGRADARGRGELRAGADYAEAVLANGLGRYDRVLAALPASDGREELRTSWLLPEQIEAAARAGESVLARTLVDRLLERTSDNGAPWAAGIRARSLALVADGPVAERLHQDAIRHLSATPFPGQRARAHLLYGEWLRRERRRVDARAQLRIAHDLLSAMGATAFAARASRELAATGERARKRTVDTAVELTPREEEIARLAGAGESNPEIAGRLFISTRTVEYHLHKVFTKLGISSRAQLEWSLPTVPAEGSGRP